MADLKEITLYTAQLLEHSAFDDMALNGLQVEGRPQVGKIVAAVDAALETVEIAVKSKADILLVHHGIFWGKDVPLTGPRLKTIRLLIENGISLLASHIPLDAHQEFGNNFQLARHLGLTGLDQFLPYKGRLIGCLAENDNRIGRDDLVAKLRALPGAQANFTCLNFGPAVPERVGICSGSAMYSVERSHEDGFDTFITGEPKQFAYHYAKEHSLNVWCAGHYATETLGVRSLAEHLAQKFNLSSEFIDIPTGI